MDTVGKSCDFRWKLAYAKEVTSFDIIAGF